MSKIKNFLFLAFMLTTFYHFAQYNVIYTIYMYGILLIPILLVILLNYKKIN